MQIVIIGGSISGIYAAIECRTRFKQATITLIEQKETLGHLPKNLFQGLANDRVVDHSPIVKEQILTEEYRIDLLLGLKCERLRDHEILLTSGKSLPFDKLILATGSTQRSRLAGTTEDLSTYWSYKSWQEQDEVIEKIKAAQTIAIVGAGALGIAFASSLAHTKKELHIYERNERPLARYFDADMTPILTRFLQSEQINMHFSDAVERILPHPKKGYLLHTSLGEQVVDLVLVAVNTRALEQEVTRYLAKNSDGTLWVDDYLQTSQTDVFAIGDAIHVRFRATGEECYISSLENASRTAYIVARNLAHLTQKDPGSIRPFEGEFFDTTYLALGLLEQEAIFVSYPVAIQSFKLDTTTLIKVIYQKRTRQLLGVQLIAQNLKDQVKQMMYDAVDQALIVDQWLEELEKVYQ